jgi:hypothetical protein
MMFHSVNMVMVKETKFKRPVTGVPKKRLDPKNGEFFLERVSIEKVSQTPRIGNSRPKTR